MKGCEWTSVSLVACCPRDPLIVGSIQVEVSDTLVRVKCTLIVAQKKISLACCCRTVSIARYSKNFRVVVDGLPMAFRLPYF